MKKSNGRRLGLLIIPVIMSAGFVAFKQAQRTARVKPRYVLATSKVYPNITVYGKGRTADTEIDVIIRDRWPYFARIPGETTSWQTGPAYISYKSRTRMGEGSLMAERLMPFHSYSTHRLIKYKVALKRVPKDAHNVILESLIKINEQTSGESQIPLRIKLR
jgi:hypothetical protein